MTPPRYRWLARGTVGVVCLALLLTGTRAGWARAARRRLDAAVAAAHARGEPAAIDDFTDPAVSADTPDAAALLTSAANAMAVTKPQLDWLDQWSSDVPLTDADRAVRLAIVRGNAGPLLLAGLAVDVPTADWQVRLPRPAMAVNAAALLSRQRLVADLLQQAVDVDLDAADGAAAVRRWRAMVRQSDALSTAWPQVMTHLNAGGISSTVADSVARHAAALPVADPAARDQVGRLIRQLTDESAFAAGGRRAWYGERLNGIDLAADPASVASVTTAYALPGNAGGNPVAGAVMWAVRPLATMDAVRLFQDDTALAAAGDRPTWPAARAVAPPPAAPLWSNLATAEALAWNTFLPTYGSRVVEIGFRNRTNRRAAAVLLALRLYTADHGGRLPATLDALVPAYLPAVPVDPMSAGGSPLRYVAAAGVVYSVGSDGVDDGGSTATPRRGRSTSRWESKDAVYAYGVATPP